MGMFQIVFFKIKKKRKIITNTKKNDAKAFIYIYIYRWVQVIPGITL